ncbi:hypothetical protein Pedsa_2462 [Pseudopedobacter saltans DSM 12145]|uniref:Outer membrane protein beta-barrel domain-containing protein n=1 Tax=Pseudopedobacter saltans (strain ATCC 51119 / DSM 12145 / JCM 21818 / CCUG 39354 / LMG 10337 / NBRC 100064 / NCIMB 13643) TaxID=762903 RepID=F0SEU1_PSESL|nr:hypothetical protein [Pseudopedobacter saltans]ADY53007.1 hypothetical protein Pedsa_2462 [Pseudopedobacter saltans DSM 12145]
MSLSLSAQIKETFVKGQLDLENGTSHQGYFKRETLKSMRNGVTFKKELADDGKYYKASDVKEAKFETGEIFRTISCLDAANQKKEIFLASLLVDGKTCLYESVFEEDFIYILSKEGEYAWLQDDKIIDGSLKRFYFRNKLAALLSSDKISYSSFGNIGFNDKELIKIVSLYNNQESSKNIVIQKNVDKLTFLVIGLSGMYKNNNEQEYNASVVYRSYFPSLSQSTSLNIGLNYYYNIHTNNRDKFKRQLYTLPLFLRQNLLRKSIRPYVDIGLNVSYIEDKFFDTNRNAISKGFQQDYGLGFLVGGGVETDIFKHFQIKAEYKFENYNHLLMAGFARVIKL